MNQTREKIEMVNEMITNERIEICSSCTIFCKTERESYPDIDQLEKEVKGLRKNLKNEGVSLGQTKTLKLLKEKKEEYKNMVNEYHSTFDKLVEEWKKKMVNGIYTGCVDDEDLNNVIYPLKWKLEQMNYRSTLLSMMKEIKHNVKEIEIDLSNGTKFSKVSI